MHAERDMIQNIVQPAVNIKLNEQGEYVSFSDLRWGINTISDSTKHRILDACFDEIDSCKPFFIVFIGGRYGWIPSKELVTPYHDRFGNIDILNKSVTELEVLYALKLNANDLNRCLFYFKDDANYEDEGGLKREEVIERIGNLRYKIEKIAPAQIRHYNSIVDTQTEEMLANQIESDICNIISSEKTLSWQERIAKQMKVKFDTSLPGLTSQWLDGLKNEFIDLAVLLFPECKVKESLIINFASQIRGHKKNNFINRLFGRGNNMTNAIYVNVGATKEISETYELQRYLIFQICDTCKFDIPQMEDLSDVKLRILMSDLLTRIANAGNELYIIISEYDKLIDAQNTKWLPDIIKNVTWIVALSNQSIAESLPSSTHKKSIYGSSHLGIVPFEEQITAYEKWSNKTVTLQVKDAIKKLPYANDYMMLEIIYNRLMHIDGRDIPDGDTGNIPEYMEQYIKKAPSNNEAVHYFLSGDYHKFDTDLCEFIFMCMAFLNRGLTISDIERLAQKIGLSWTELDIIRFLNYESFLLTQYEDGRYDISSSALSCSLAKSYHQKFKFEYSVTLYDYLNDIPDTTPIKIDNFWFLCYQTNHFKEYLDYLNSLYEVRIDNANLKAAFLPLFSNAEAIRWLLISFKREKLQYISTGFIAELVSIVANTFSSYSPTLTEEFISATKNIENISRDLTTEFRQHYTLAIDKISNYDYNGFIEEFDACFELSEKQFKENPPRFKYLDEDVEHKYPIGSFQDMIDKEFGFAFVEDMAALMSKYGDLPKEYQDETKASYYAEKAKEIRTRISRASYILPKDALKIKKENAKKLERKKPSLLRGRAVELSKQAERTDNVDSKIIIIKEAIEILNDILAMPEDDLVGEFKDSQKTLEYETTIYEECFRDRALAFSHLASILEDDKYDLLHKAFDDILRYAKSHDNEQVNRDILRIAQPLATVSLENGHDDLCLDCCVKAYEAFAFLKPQMWFIFLGINIDEYVYKVTVGNASLQDRWISECKRMINSFQSQEKSQSMFIIIKALYESLKRYVLEEQIERHRDMYMWLMESMSCHVKEMMNDEYFMRVYNDASMLLNKEFIRGKECLSVLNTMYQYANSLLLKGDFDQSLERCKEIKKLCKNKNDNSQEFNTFVFHITELFAHIYMEKNDIVMGTPYMNSIVSKYEDDFKRERNLNTLIGFVNAKLNQVLLWDKMAVDDTMHMCFLLGDENYNCKAEKQLYDIYMLCYNFEEQSEEKGLLMRRIRQTLEIIKDKCLGHVSTPKTLSLVKHFKGIVNEAIQAEKEGNHEECIKKFKLVVKALRNRHWVDIYFQADWYAGILYVLGQDAWKNGEKEEATYYYEEAVQIRCELDAEEISQNTENFALLLYFYALVILSKQLTQESISQVIDFLNKSQSLFEKIENQLGPDSLSNYSSCCFNLGQIICLYTTGGNEVGLPFVESAINIMERLVNNYGLTKYQKDVEQFRRQYLALKNRR